jgi:hypothetical protein
MKFSTKTKRDQTQQSTKEFTMKWTTVFAILALIFTFGSINAQAQNFDVAEVFQTEIRNLIESNSNLSSELQLALTAFERWNGRVNNCAGGEASTFNNQSQAQGTYDFVREACYDATQADGDFNGDGTVDGTDFIVWHYNPSTSSADSFYMFELRLPGTDLVIVGFVIDTPEPRARKIYIGELSVTKPDHEIDGEPED